MWGVCLIWIQSLNAPFIWCLNLCCCTSLGVCTVTHFSCVSASFNKAVLCLHTHTNRQGVQNICSLQSLSSSCSGPLYRSAACALPRLPLSPADCRFYHIWSFTAPCLTAFQVHFLPVLPLAASCSVGAHVYSGIGRNMKSGQDERSRLKSDVVSVTESLAVSQRHVEILTAAWSSVRL